MKKSWCLAVFQEKYIFITSTETTVDAVSCISGSALFINLVMHRQCECAIKPLCLWMRFQKTNCTFGETARRGAWIMNGSARICPQGLSVAAFAQIWNTGLGRKYIQIGFIMETAERKDANKSWCGGNKKKKNKNYIVWQKIRSAIVVMHV